jgi:hypothetical protein
VDREKELRILDRALERSGAVMAAIAAQLRAGGAR